MMGRASATRRGGGYCILLAALAAGPAATGAGSVDWGATGRPLPQARLPRPTLDPQLRPYRPCPVDGRSLAGTAPAILPALVERWIRAFGQVMPAVAIIVPPPYGSPLGVLNPRLDRFLKGEGDLAFLTRAMSPADRATFETARGYAPVIVPVAGGSFAHRGFVDPVVVVVHDSNPVERLGQEDLRRLFASSVAESARPKTWGELGVAAWRDRPVQVVGGAAWGGEPSARGLVVRERLLGGDALRTDLGAASGDEAGVPARVAADPHAIGFTGLGHLLPGLRPLPIADDAGVFVAPDFDEVAGARYPLARTVDVVIATRPGQPLDPALAEFLRFLLSRDGQAIVLEQGVFLPLRAGQSAAASQQLGLAAAGCGDPRTAPPADED